MKKLLLGLGAATSVIAPIAAVVACSGEDKADFGGKVIMGDNLVTLAATIKAQTGIDFEDGAGKAIVTKLSGVVGTTTLTMVGDLKTALGANNGFTAIKGKKVALKVALTVDANDAKKFTAKVTIDGHPLKMSGTALTSPQAVTVATLLINEVAKEPATTETPTGQPAASISDMYATVTNTNLGAMMTGTYTKSTVPPAEQTKYLNEIMSVLKASSKVTASLVTTMSISYTDLNTADNTGLSGTVLLTLSTAVETYTKLPNRTTGEKTVIAAIKAALDTIFA